MNNPQKTLFDLHREEMVEPSKLARDSDPPSSHRAAESLIERLPTRRRQTYDAAVSLGPQGSHTANEIACRAFEMFGGMHDTYRRRCLELVEAGVFRVGPERECTVSRQTTPSYRIAIQ